ncbi:MucB/RseB C-terminal domain-containing protein [Thiohalorhabdus sp. Cl-TMA]|uniref:MucB/RseB C-terminal domain-containing protein n=1 Tax=Thiohalorhabdus methylotrophus TaxID=3242694 RepID=A0ABV4TYS2_9GAMM
MAPVRLFPIFAVLLAAVQVSIAEAKQGQVEAEVKRMIQAAREMSYQGVLVHGVPVGVESMRLFHRGGPDGSFRERLVMLTGPARELVREDDQIKRYHPDIGQVISGPRRSGTAIFKLAEKDLDRVRKYYSLTTGPTGRVAGRQARAVEFRAQDDHRFTYRVWRDVSNNLPLQTEILSEDGRVMETFMFAVVSPNSSLDEEDLRMKVPEAARHLERRALEEGNHPEVLSRMKLPPGFRLDARFGVPGEAGGTHLFFTDGLATLSVFLEKVKGNVDLSGKAGDILQRGALHACSVHQGRYRITLLGELPGPAIRRIAASLAAPSRKGAE